MKNTVQKTSKLSHDGRQLMTRIPKAIQEEANLKKGEEIEWEAKGDKMKVRKTKKEFLKEVADAAALPAQTCRALGPESEEDIAMYAEDKN